MSIGNNIKKWREIRNLKQSELAELVGVSDKTVSSWEINRTEPKMGMVEKISTALNCKKTDIIGEDTYTPISVGKGVTINVLGRVAAGIPIEAVEEIIDTEEITEAMAKTGTYFGLKIHGDSMEPRMYEGDVVIVRQQDDAESGDIVIAMVNGDDATCKRLMKYEGGISLISLNSKYTPMMFTEQDIINKPVKIIGKVVELRGKL